MKCPKCGSELIPQDNVFFVCAGCGGRFRKKDPIIDQPLEVQKKKTEAASEPKQSAEKPKEAPEATKGSAKRGKRIAVIVIASVILLAIVIVCLVLFTGGNGMYYSVNMDVDDDFSKIEKSVWLRLDKGKWENSDQSEGEYTKIGNKILLYQNGVRLAEGTLRKGTLTVMFLGVPIAYRTAKAQEKIKEKMEE